MSDTFVSRLTAELPSAIATIAVSGPSAIDAVLQYARIATDLPETNRVYYGRWQLSETTASEQVVVCKTDDETIEIHCHGGNAVCAGILDGLRNAGCIVVASDRWSARRERCPVEAAAHEDLIRANTDRAAAILLDQLAGALTISLKAILGFLECGDWHSAQAGIDALLLNGRAGLHLSMPWRVVLAGPPNTGKSSLINAIVGWQQSIVHADPGTTRDWVESQCAIDGWPVCMSDTAGIRPTEDPIESAGVERALEQISQADLIVAVVDGTVGWQESHQRVLQLAETGETPLLIAWNKSDLCDSMEPPAFNALTIATSTCGAPGTDDLLAAIAETLVPAELKQRLVSGASVPFRAEHMSRLMEVQVAIERREIPQAVAILRSFSPRLG